MSRVPKEELERIKQAVPMAKLAEARGVALTRVGAELRGCCPMHDDTTPSFFIDETKNVWVCHGACAAGGSVVDFVMRTEGIYLKHAVEWLQAFEAGKVSPTTRTPVKATIPKLEAPFELEADDQVVLNRYAAYCHQVLKKTPAAQAYLESRGLVSSELVDKFQLGFSDRSLGMRLPAKGRAAGENIRARLQKLGIMKPDVGHELMCGSLTVPISDENGQVLGMYGRKIARQREGTPLHMYLPGPHRGVWNLEALKSSKTVILCEAALDAMTFWCAGLRNVTWAYGVNGFTDEHLDAFKKHGTRHVLIAFDHDAAGDKGTELVAERLGAAGIGVYRIKFPSGIDANDFGQKMKPMARCFRILCRQALHVSGPTLDLQIEFPLDAAEIAAVTTQDPLLHPMAQLEQKTPAPVAVPAAAAVEEEFPGCKVDGDEVYLTLSDRRWRVRGWLKNRSTDVLKVNVMVTDNGKCHVDNLDLYSSRARKFFVADAMEEIRGGVEVLRAEIGTVLRLMERLQIRRLKEDQKPKVVVPPMTPEEREAAMALLRDDKVCDRIVADLTKCGLVGEEANKLTAYLGCVSRRLPHPLAIMVHSGSASGKTTLMDAVLAFMPPEERQKYSALTERSLYYVGEEELSHKILAVVEEEGAELASYALKLLQSEGELIIASTAKDPQTGQLATRKYHVKGPVMIFVTTTKDQQDHEWVNRCLLLTGDESREQTRAIHDVQREKRTVAGLFRNLDRADIRTLHQNAQRLLKSVDVVNLYARDLTFTDAKTRTRRDFEKYLTLIDSVAVLRQHQKVLKREGSGDRTVEYIEVDARDLEIANALAVEVLGRTLDELQTQTRKLLTMMEENVARVCEERACKREDFLFSRRELLDWTSWSYDQLRIHLGRLIEQEYVLVHRGNRGHQYFYELLYDGAGKDGGRFVPGLVDPTRATNPPTSPALEGISHSVGPTLDPRWRPVGAGVVTVSKVENTASEQGVSAAHIHNGAKSTDTGLAAETIRTPRNGTGG